MPTNQSSPWGGGKPRACSNTESPTNTSTTAKTAKKKVMAAKVPLSQSSLDLSRRKDQAKSLSTKVASSTAPSVPMWEKGDGYKCDTYSQFTTTTAATVPDGSPKMPGQVKHNRSPNQVLVNGLKKASGSPTHTNATSPKKECQNGFTVQTSQPGNDGDVPLGLDSLLSLCHEDLFMKGQPPTLQQTNKFMPEAADCSSLPPVPPLCLTQCDHRGAAFDENTPSFESTQHRSTATETTTSRRIHSAKTTTKPNLTSTLNDQLLVRGVPPAMVVSPTNTKPQILAPLELKKQVQESPSTLSTGRRISPTKVCPVQNGPVPSALGVSATAETQPTVQEANTVVSPGPAVAMVGSVTTQISEIQLDRPGPAACVSPPPPPPSPSPSPSLYPSSPSPSATPSPTESEEGLGGGTQMSGQEECAMQVDGLEEELPDELENACSDDDDSDCSSRNGASSTTSSALLSSVEDPMLLGAEDEREEKPALVPSLFPLIPPTLYFSTANEKVELLPAEQRRMLKWKMSAVTPNVVKHTINRSHFKVTKKSHDWLGCWGHHMKSPGFKAIGEHQKLNHFPGTFQIGRKDRLWRNLSKMKVRFGKQEFNFFPRTFVLPQDIKLLRRAWEDCGSREKWIIKPPASARGIGIQVIHKWSQMPRRRPLLVQKYLHKPYLISGNKFDLRIYVYVTSYDPLRVYIFSDGLVRFASCKYSSSLKTLSNKFMHLTNYSVNKKNSEYQSNSDDKACQGHKWALKALWRYLGSKGVNTTLIWSKIKDIVIKTIIASEPYVNSLLKMHLRTPYSCHELFGFDIMLDENLKPWILEVNISPSLHSNTALDVAVKGQMIRDLLNLAGFRIPQREDVVASCSSTSSSTSSLCGGNRERQKPDPSSDEKVKRAFYLTQRYADQDFLSSVLDVLTPEDVRVLAETEDELTRLGEFERIFPSPISSRYLRFFEVPRYLNILLDQWEHKFWNNRTKGISHLRSLCQRGVHLGTNNPAHLWSKCSYISRFETHRPDTRSPSRSRGVVVSHQHRSHHDDGDLDDGSDREVASVSSLPLSPSPGSSVSSSACASPIPSLAHCSLQFDSV